MVEKINYVKTLIENELNIHFYRYLPKKDVKCCIDADCVSRVINIEFRYKSFGIIKHIPLEELDKVNDASVYIHALLKSIDYEFDKYLNKDLLIHYVASAKDTYEREVLCNKWDTTKNERYSKKRIAVYRETYRNAMKLYFDTLSLLCKRNIPLTRKNDHFLMFETSCCVVDIIPASVDYCRIRGKRYDYMYGFPNEMIYRDACVGEFHSNAAIFDTTLDRIIESIEAKTKMDKDLLNLKHGAGGKIIYKNGEYIKSMNKDLLNLKYGVPKFEIKNVIFNDPATIVIWADGTKTIVKCGNGDKFDPEKGLAMAVAKKALGTNESKSNFNDIFKKWMSNESEGKIKYISVKEYAEEAGVNKSTVRKWINSGKIKDAEMRDGKWFIKVVEY